LFWPLALAERGSPGATTEPKIREILGLSAENDYSGTGVDPEIQIVVEEGEYGDVIAQKLVDAGVTKSFDAGVSPVARRFVDRLYSR